MVCLHLLEYEDKQPPPPPPPLFSTHEYSQPDPILTFAQLPRVQVSCREQVQGRPAEQKCLYELPTLQLHSSFIPLHPPSPFLPPCPCFVRLIYVLALTQLRSTLCSLHDFSGLARSNRNFLLPCSSENTGVIAWAGGPPRWKQIKMQGDKKRKRESVCEVGYVGVERTELMGPPS